MRGVGGGEHALSHLFHAIASVHLEKVKVVALDVLFPAEKFQAKHALLNTVALTPPPLSSPLLPTTRAPQLPFQTRRTSENGSYDV